SDALPASGGGVYSKFWVKLYSASSITGNFASSSGSKALGGGIFAYSVPALTQGSIVSDNTAGGAQAFGGGIYCKGHLSTTNASITYNYAHASGVANGGGVFLGGYLDLELSSLSHNVTYSAAGAYGGGANVGRTYAGYSSIDSNSALGYGFGG